MARTSAKAQLSRMQIVEEEKRLTHPTNSQSLQMHSSNSSLSGSGGGSASGSVPGSVAGSGNGRSAASTLIRTLPESQSSTSRSAIDLVLSSSSPGANSGNPNNFQSHGDEQQLTNTTLSGLAHPTQFHLTQLEKKHQHIRSLLTHTPVQNQQMNNTNFIPVRGDVNQDTSRTTASTNSPNGMGSTDRIEDLELVGLTSEFMEETDINRIEPTMCYAGPTGSVIDQNELFSNTQHRTATSVVEGFQIGNSGSVGITGSVGGSGSHPRRSAPSSLPARFNFGSGPVVVPVRQVSGASGIAGTSVGCMPAVVGSAESGSGTTVGGGGGGQSSSRAASRSSLMVPEEDVSNSAEMKQRQKKDQHNKVERKRREQINHFIAMLGDMLPKRMFEGNDNKKNKGTVLRKTTELIEKLSDENRELRALLSRSCEVLQSVYPLISNAVENNVIHLSHEDLNNYMEVLQALIVKERSEILTDSPGQPVGELSPSSAASCPPADTPISMHPPTPSGLSAVPENSSGNASGSLTGSIPPSSNMNHLPRSGSGENHSLLLTNARSAPSSLSTHYYASRTAFVKEEDSDMFSSHDLTHVEPAELHTLLAQISSPTSKQEPTDRSFNQSSGDATQLNTSSPSYTNLTLGFIEDMDTNDGVTSGHIMVSLDGSEGMDM